MRKLTIIEKTGVAVVGLLAILFITVFIMGKTPEYLADQAANADTAAHPDPKLTAESIARNFVRQKVPSATLPPAGSTEYKTAFLGGTSYRVVSWVEAVNASGVKVRMPWGATVVDQGPNWRLDSLAIDGQVIVAAP